MEINKHICFRSEQATELVLYLMENGFINKIQDTIALDIFESNMHWPYIQAIVNNKSLFCLSETLFTKKELADAQWLAVRSKWNCGYPQPEDGFKYESITYSNKNFCFECGAGLHQVEDFRMKKTPNWGKRHFMMLNWVSDELFLDDVAKAILIGSDISGIQFRNVKNKNGTEFLQNINQLIVPTVLPAGIITDRRSIDEVNECPNCGVKKYHPTGIGMYAFKRSIFDGAPDVVKTAECFGWGGSAPRLVLISQKMYRIITQNCLDSALVFTPLELV